MANLGHKLSEARNRKGISIREASESTKIRGDYLTRFENDDFDVNLPPVYLRGFLTNYARYLDLDPEGILADFELLQPPDKRRPRKAFGAITVDSPADEGGAGDSQPQPHGQLDDSVVFPWLKVGLALGGIFIATIITVLIVQKCTDGDSSPSSPASSPVVDPNVPGETSATSDAEVRVLKLIVSGPIKMLYVTPEGDVRQIFRELDKGNERELTFKNSFTGAASSIENLKFEINGKQFGFQGTGPLTFSWPSRPPKED